MVNEQPYVTLSDVSLYSTLGHHLRDQPELKIFQVVTSLQEAHCLSAEVMADRDFTWDRGLAAHPDILLRRIVVLVSVGLPDLESRRSTNEV